MGAAATAACVVLPVAGCGGGERQDAHETAGTYKVDVVSHRFPLKQRLANASVMTIAVKNTDSKAIPNVAVTITNDDDAKGGAGFATRSDQPGLADPSRPLWIVDVGPHGGDTAYVSTWALGRLAPGATKTFVWHVTPVVAGSHRLRWHVAAGLNGKAVARTDDGKDPVGTFAVDVSRKPRAVVVDPKTGDVVDADDAKS
ncbi:MAG TPA: hypothetical protein VFG42_16300 [Baekduia sp.]|nr:hypothetical protein [Baekduia sp.]